MTEFRSFLALFAYPAIVILVFNWWSAASRWARKNRTFFLPPDLRVIEEGRGRFLLLFKYALLLVVLRGLAGISFGHFVPVTAHLRSWLTLIFAGIAGGIVLLVCRRVLVLTFRAIALTEPNDYLLRGPSLIWLLIFLIGSFTEEFWRAVCVFAFQKDGYSAMSACLWAAFAFSIAHLSGLPARIPGGLENVGPEMFVGLTLGALLIWSGNLIAPFLASLIYYASNFFWLLHRYPIPASSLAEST